MCAEGYYIDLIIGPAIHTKRLDLRYVCAKFAMERGAAHAQKDPQLMFVPPVSRFFLRIPSLDNHHADWRIGLRSSWPNLRSLS